MGLKLGIISLGSKSTKMLVEEAKEIFDEVDMIDIRKVEIRLDKTTTVLYDGESMKNFDCIYIFR